MYSEIPFASPLIHVYNLQGWPGLLRRQEGPAGLDPAVCGFSHLTKGPNAALEQGDVAPIQLFSEELRVLMPSLKLARSVLFADKSLCIKVNRQTSLV